MSVCSVPLHCQFRVEEAAEGVNLRDRRKQLKEERGPDYSAYNKGINGVREGAERTKSTGNELIHK